MIVEDKKYYDFSDVLIKPRMTTMTSRSEASIEREFYFKNSGQTIVSSPIIISNMDIVGNFTMAKAVDHHKIMTCFHKFYTLVNYDLELNQDETKSFNFVTIGIGEISFNHILNMKNLGFFAKNKLGICVDVANGYMTSLWPYLEKLRKMLPNTVIMAGNICTPEPIQAFANVGVDVIKAGVGSGAQCLTRTVAGVGVPQFTAVMDCVEAADKLGILVCSDGGINDYADFGKALGAGADFVMSGSMFAGHHESGGDVITLGGKQYKEMYGMSSRTAQNKYYGGMAKYRASEGRTSLIPLKGPVEDTIQNIFGGIRSAMSYTNSRTLEEFPSNVTFIPVNDTINRKYEQNTIGN
jgi:GMP reductase